MTFLLVALRGKEIDMTTLSLLPFCPNKSSVNVLSENHFYKSRFYETNDHIMKFSLANMNQKFLKI